MPLPQLAKSNKVSNSPVLRKENTVAAKNCYSSTVERQYYTKNSLSTSKGPSVVAKALDFDTSSSSV